MACRCPGHNQSAFDVCMLLPSSHACFMVALGVAILLSISQSINYISCLCNSTVYGTAIFTCMVYFDRRCCGSTVCGMTGRPCMVYGTAILTRMVYIACRCCGSTVCGMTGRPCTGTGGPTGCTISWRMTQWRSWSCMRTMMGATRSLSSSGGDPYPR